MAFSWEEFTATAGQTTVAVNIAYLDKGDIHLELNDSEVTGFTWASDTLINIPSTVTVSAGDKLAIVRKTDRAELRILFSEGAAFDRDNLDEQNDQFLYLAQELVEGRSIDGFYGDISMNDYRITDLGAPAADSDAANKGYVDAEVNEALAESAANLADAFKHTIRTGVELAELTALRPNRLLGFDAQGNPTTYSAATGSALALAQALGSSAKGAGASLVVTEDGENLEDAYQRSVQELGDYESGPLTLTRPTQEIRYGGVKYYLKETVALPYTTTGNSAATWVVDKANFLSVGGADLAEALAESDGYQSVGGFYDQEGVGTTDPSTGVTLTARRGARGQFDVVSNPWESRGLAGITFGGDYSRGTFTVDSRGMVRTSVWHRGRQVQKDVLLPVLQDMGIYYGPDKSPGVLLRMGAPDNSPSLFVTYDSNGLPVLGVMGAQQFGEYGSLNPADEGSSYSILPSRKDVQSAIAASTSNYQKNFVYPLPANDNNYHVWVPVATFTTATGSGNANGVFKALVTVSGNVFPNGRSYLLSGNSRGLSSVTLSSSNVNSYYNLTALDAPQSDDASNADYIVSAGVTQSGNTVTLYLKMPYSCAYSTIQALNVGFSGYVSYTPTAFKTQTTAPSGLIYLTTVTPYNTSNVTVSSDGSLMAASPIVRVATGVNNSDRADIASDSFHWSGSGTVNREAADATVTYVDTGTYLIPNSKLATSGWSSKAPKSPTGGEILALVEAVDTDAGVLVKVYAQVNLINEGVMTVTKGALMDVPSSSWVDIRLEPSN